jgi:myo-inositol-1(or 4)-monophosphatase
MQFSPITEKTIEIVKKSGAVLREGFQTHFAIYSKPGKHNLVTEYDYKSEKLIIEFIEKHFPEAAIMSEEKGGHFKNLDNEYIFIIDPLDGTVNFAHNIPQFAVSIGILKNQQLFAGVVYHPLLEELFVAEVGKGAYFNGRKIEVSKKTLLSEAILATGFPYNSEVNPLKCIDKFGLFIRLGIPIRRLGSAALDMCYVACSRFDAFWETNLGPWDVLGASVIVKEAGGTLLDWKGNPFTLEESNNTILATNGKIDPEMVKILKEGCP